MNLSGRKEVNLLAEDTLDAVITAYIGETWKMQKINSKFEFSEHHNTGLNPAVVAWSVKESVFLIQ